MDFEIKKSNKEKCKSLLFIILLLLNLCLLHNLLKHGILLFWERTIFSDRMASMIAMAILSLVLVLASHKFGWKLSIFPQPFTRKYLLATIIYITILIIMPSNYTGGLEPILMLFYMCIITPIFEEIIFRGLVWNKLQDIYKSQWTVFTINTVLFGLWHLGYADSIAFYVGERLYQVLFWKVITGLCFGIVLGIARKYTKNSYATILLHGVMNALGK